MKYNKGFVSMILIGKTGDCISRPQKGVWGMNAGGVSEFVFGGAEFITNYGVYPNI